MSAEPHLVVEDLRVNLLTERKPVAIVRGVSFSLSGGQRVALLGESGAGKSVLARCIAGILPEGRFEVSGSVRVGGVEFAGRSRRALRSHRGKVGLVFQDPTRTLNPTMRIGAQIEEALVLSRGKAVRRKARTEGVDLLARVGIADPERRYDSYPHELSGGMRQRVVIAITVAMSPDVLIADEATTSLDVTMQAQIMKLLTGLTASSGTALLVITHDIALAASTAEDIMVMYAGRIVERLSASGIFESPAMPYTRALVGAVPGGSGRERRLPQPIPGTTPEPGLLPSGCPYHPRCDVSTEVCKREEPALVELSPRHASACWLTSPQSTPAQRVP